MIIIIDTNILISASLDNKSELYHLITSEFLKLDFVIPEYALEEINAHKIRICTKAKKEIKQFENNLFILLKTITVLSINEISNTDFLTAEKLTKQIDIKDATFVAFSISFNSLLWTGDLKLYKALRRKSFNNIITTKELKQIIKGII
jgi:predicted nucleic acid-binding protein